jgi:hypothetical protein
MLSPDQFQVAADSLREHGGFSIKVAGPGVGTSPKGNKLMVGGYKNVGEDIASHHEVTASDLRDYSERDDTAPVLAEKNIYLGGWTSDNPPRTSVEASQAFPVRKGYEAGFAAAETNQEAIGVIESGEYTGDINYPYYQKDAGHATRNPDLFDAAWASSKGHREVDPVWQEIK